MQGFEMSNARAIEEKNDAALTEVIEIDTDVINKKSQEKANALFVTKNYINSNSSLAAFLTLAILSCSKNSNGELTLKYSIPTAIWLAHILPFLVPNVKTCHSMALVNRPVSLFFKKYLVDTRLAQLLQHIAYGQKEDAEKIIKSNPGLLLLSGPIVKDYAGREIQQYPYQMVLAAADVFVKFKNDVYQPDAQGEEMKEMIERYCIELLGEEKGVAELERQRKMIFSDDFEEHVKQKRVEDLAAVTEMFKAIGDAEVLDEEGLLEECGKALKKFKTHLEPKGIITTTTQGYHFDPQILVEAFRLYDANYATFGNNWNSPKNLFAWQKVIGLIQRYLTACDAMVLCQGPYYLVRDGEPFERTLNFRFGGGVYFPLDADPSWSFGKNGAAGGGEGLGAARRFGRLAWGARGISLGILCRAKTSSLQKPMQRPDNHSKTRCVIL
jgi:hypothetical protein